MTWWHDSAVPSELEAGLTRGATGVTTNPVLSWEAIQKDKGLWTERICQAVRATTGTEEKAEELMRIPLTDLAGKLLREYEASRGERGYVCAQVNPAKAADRESMASMATRFHSWAPNISVKLPATAAGLDVLEGCVADGISVTSTVSFSVAQVIEIAEKYRKGVTRARNKRIAPGKCFAVIMIGRIDDYLWDCAKDSHAGIEDAELCQAGLAIVKRAYSIYRQRNYQPRLIIAALRGTYHFTELAGADLIMSIHPKYQEPLLDPLISHQERIDKEIAASVIEKLSSLPEFVKAFEPDGLDVRGFLAFGLTQRTLTQFYNAGWKQLEDFKVP
jgi:transaldolase